MLVDIVGRRLQERENNHKTRCSNIFTEDDNRESNIEGYESRERRGDRRK
jgi:hypothetical protein